MVTLAAVVFTRVTSQITRTLFVLFINPLVSVPNLLNKIGSHCIQMFLDNIVSIFHSYNFFILYFFVHSKSSQSCHFQLRYFSCISVPRLHKSKVRFTHQNSRVILIVLFLLMQRQNEVKKSFDCIQCYWMRKLL